MRVVTLDSTASVTRYVPLSYSSTPFNVGIMAVVVSGTPTITVSHTLEDFNNVAVSTPSYWINHATLVAVASIADGNYAFPVRCLRVTQNGAGKSKVCIIQAG